MARSKSDYALLWANGMKFGQVHDLMAKDIRKAAGLSAEGGPLYFVERIPSAGARPFVIREVDSDELLDERFGNRRDAEKRAEQLNAQPKPVAEVREQFEQDELSELQAKLAEWESRRAERAAKMEERKARRGQGVVA